MRRTVDALRIIEDANKRRKERELNTTTQHTSGPWHVYQPNDYYRQGREPTLHVGAGAVRIAVVGDHIQPTAANAQLIAAAPELLEALRHATSHLQNLMEELGISVVGTSGYGDVVGKANAAIAKAEGRS